jgi:hypothetical protein
MLPNEVKCGDGAAQSVEPARVYLTSIVKRRTMPYKLTNNRL